MKSTIYEAAGGRPAFHALAHAWHRRCLADPVVSHAFTHGDGHPEHTTRLAALRDWFRWATAEMARHPDSADDVPSGLPMPHWTWDGPA